MDYEYPEKQVAFIQDCVRRVREEHEIEIPDWGRSGWQSGGGSPSFGMMHEIFIDSDWVIYIMSDPYGGGTLAVGAVDWFHNDADEDCGCPACEKERLAEEALDAEWERRRQQEQNDG